MKHRVLFLTFFAFANGCTPSVPANEPVLTTTSIYISTTTEPSSDSTTTSILNTTTIPAANTTTTLSTTNTTTAITTTTTPRPMCCGYPVNGIGQNAADPPQVSFNCSEPIMMTCQNNNLNTIDEVAVVVNYNSTSNIIPLQSDRNEVKLTITCDINEQKWVYQITRFTNVSCAYKVGNVYNVR